MTLIVQVLLTLFLGWCVFILWRHVASKYRAVGWIVTVGLLIRAVGGQTAFWVSYLHLPIARSLQIGGGLWIFAVDSITYFENASGAASGGLGSILFLHRDMASVFYVQTLALLMLMLGAVTSVAILLNVAAYLGCCLAILSFGDPNKNRAVVFAIAALSFSPSAIVWTLQPLKDTLFLFLVAAFFGAARVWQQAWSVEKSPRRLTTVSVTTLLMVAALYGISGIRWYFGIVMVLASMPFVLLTMLRSTRRWAVLVNALVLVLLLGAAFFSGAGPYVPQAVRDAVFGRDVRKQVALPQTLLKTVVQARNSFERAGGATTIGAGGATREIDATLGAEERRTLTADEQPEKKGESTQTVTVTPAPPEPSPVTSSAERAQTSSLPPPVTSTIEPAPVSVVPPPVTSSLEPAPASIAHPPVTGSAEPAPAPIGHPPVVSSAEPAHTAQPTITAASPLAVPAPRPVNPIAVKNRPHYRPAPVERSVKTAVVQPPVPRVRQPHIPRQSPGVGMQPAEGGSTAGAVTVPASPLARLFAGTAAVVLPLSIARRLGILDIRGGRGLWLFVEVDTIGFDIVLIFTLVSLARAVRRRTLRAPVFWMILLVTLAIGGALAYAVSNFGTLFRHRNMVFLGLLLLPLALDAQRSRSESAGEPADEAVQA